MGERVLVIEEIIDALKDTATDGETWVNEIDGDLTVLGSAVYSYGDTMIDLYGLADTVVESLEAAGLLRE